MRTPRLLMHSLMAVTLLASPAWGYGVIDDGKDLNLVIVPGMDEPTSLDESFALARDSAFNVQKVEADAFDYEGNTEADQLILRAGEIIRVIGLGEDLNGEKYALIESGDFRIWTKEADLADIDVYAATDVAGKTKYITPVKGKIMSRAGMRRHPITGKRRYHAGIDIAAPTGTPVKAAATGTVTFAGWKNGYGKAIYIQHPGGGETRYAHLSKIRVKAGQKVAQSSVIGNVGTTGLSTGPHLHFEQR